MSKNCMVVASYIYCTWLRIFNSDGLKRSLLTLKVYRVLMRYRAIALHNYSSRFNELRNHVHFIAFHAFHTLDA